MEPAGLDDELFDATSPESPPTTLADRMTWRDWIPGRRSLALLFATLVLTTVMLVLGYGNKARCVGPEFNAVGESEPDLGLRISRDVCYSDIQFLWTGRALYEHHFPYVHGHFIPDPVNPQIVGGTLEYPVLTGLVAYLTAIPADNDAQYLLYNALILGLAGLATAVLLCRLAGIRSWWYALAPPLVFYAFHNWDLLAVLSMVGAVACIARAARSSRPGRWVFSGAVLFGVGGAFKFYPLMFALPLAIWVGCGGGLILTEKARRWWAALAVLGTTALTFVLFNVPFMLAGFAGWWASFQFQWSRPIDLTTNSIWFWGDRPASVPENVAVQVHLGHLSTWSTALGLIGACLGGLILLRRTGVYPWLQVSGAMLAAYLLLNKVHSPQYVLWLLPFFVLLRIRAAWMLAYFVADAFIGIGFFRWQYLLITGVPSGVYDGFTMQAVILGVWGRAVLLVGLFGAFLVARSVLDDDVGEADHTTGEHGVVGGPTPSRAAIGG